MDVKALTIAIALVFAAGCSAGTVPTAKGADEVRAEPMRDSEGSKYELIHAFSNVQGSTLLGPLAVSSSGTVYGVANSGGPDSPLCGAIGCGAVFSFRANAPSSSFKVLAYFNSGYWPFSGPIVDPKGNVFGTTSRGGAYGFGTVWMLAAGAASHYVSTIYSFHGGRDDGALPYGGLLRLANGDIIGGSETGGRCRTSGGCGTIYRLRPTSSGYTETVLYMFPGGFRGSGPGAPLTVDSRGDLFGSAGGGVVNCAQHTACGLIYELVPRGAGYSMRVVYRFTNGPNDGACPSGPLVLLKDGSLIGSACEGGDCPICGLIYKLTPHSNGTFSEAPLYHFGYGNATFADGMAPTAGVIAVGNALEGVTKFGGNGACDLGCGTAFKLTPNGSAYLEADRYDFPSVVQSFEPAALVAAGGKVFGDTAFGGPAWRAKGCPDHCGTLFELRRF